MGDSLASWNNTSSNNEGTPIQQQKYIDVVVKESVVRVTQNILVHTYREELVVSINDIYEERNYAVIWCHSSGCIEV